MSRVFKGFRSLLASPAASSSSAMAAAKFSSTSAVAKSATSKVSQTPKKGTTSKPKAEKTSTTLPKGILKVSPVSPALGQFLGVQQVSRTEAVKQIWSYIKSQNLQNPENKREIFCDERLKAIFDGKEKVGFLEIGKLLSRHFVKTN